MKKFTDVYSRLRDQQNFILLSVKASDDSTQIPLSYSALERMKCDLRTQTLSITEILAADTRRLYFLYTIL